MSAYRFYRAAIESADTPWRALDRALARWVLVHGGDEALASIAAWASYSEGLGDTALPLLQQTNTRAAMPTLDQNEVQILRASPLVSDGSRRTPFVIDADGRFFLWRNFALEGAIAQHVRTRLSAQPVRTHSANADLDQLFGNERGDAVQAQREAVAAVSGQRLFVLTGGPGTGKTSTVLKMLLMLQRQSNGALNIALAAPTGKAAQRLLQALRHGKQTLAAQLPVDWRLALDAIFDGEAQTLHRLLGFSPERNIYTRHRDDPISADVVVVDEASMVDLAMLHALLDALRPEACLILVGDADQLTSVAAGSVLQDLVQILEHTHPQQVVRLQHSFRAARHLVAINDAVRAGDLAQLHDAISEASSAALQVPCHDQHALARQAARWAIGLSKLPIRQTTPAGEHVGANGVPHRLIAAGSAPTVGTLPGATNDSSTQTQHALSALKTLTQQQILCALREQDSGALAINQLIEQRLRSLWNIAPDQRWYAGRAIMITRNDYAAGLFNGDIGLALQDQNGALQVWFESQDDQGRPSARAFAPNGLPEHEAAFAITIHKSQGSEYDRVAVVLPFTAEHRILSRQLLYTALSRAKQSIEIWGSDEVLQSALAQIVQRQGGLAARLRP
jgi:exodeoxyribonuclease V alpha subunit